MLRITKTTESQLIELTPDRIETGAWMSLVRPTADELSTVEEITGMKKKPLYQRLNAMC